MNRLQEEIKEIRELIDKVRWQDDMGDPRVINQKGGFYRNPEKVMYRPYVVTEKNPISMYFSDDLDDDAESLLNEGIFKTYPFDDVKKWLNDIYVRDKLVTLQPLNDNKYSFVCGLKIPDVTDIENANIEEVKGNEHFKKLIRAMGWCGYYLANCKLPKSEEYVLCQFEPLFDVEFSAYTLKQKGIKTLWHISPNFYKEKILRNGLCPYSRNGKFNYPNRVYFLLPILTDEQLKTSAGELEKARRRGKLQSEINYKKTEIYTKYVIDIEKLNNTLSFSEDRNAMNSLYTTENIPPSAIISAMDFKINYENISTQQRNKKKKRR